MMYHYWFSRNDIDRDIRFHCIDCGMENMDAFLAMSRRSCLRQAVAALRETPEATYRTCPGEYLQLTAENGMVEAQIFVVEDALPVRLPVEIFCRIVTEYLEKMDAMYRELGLL